LLTVSRVSKSIECALIFSQAPKVPKISRTEEPAFPRGGASVLTPLEHKQIQIEATREVLFEQNAKASKLSKPDDEDEDAPRPKKKSKSKGKGKKGVENAEPEEEIIKIEGLSYKVLQLLGNYVLLLTSIANCPRITCTRASISN
jgi:hypothetical protein